MSPLAVTILRFARRNVVEKLLDHTRLYVLKLISVIFAQSISWTHPEVTTCLVNHKIPRCNVISRV